MPWSNFNQIACQKGPVCHFKLTDFAIHIWAEQCGDEKTPKYADDRNLWSGPATLPLALIWTEMYQPYMAQFT